MIVIMTPQGALVDGKLMSSISAQEYAAQHQNSEIWDLIYSNREEKIDVYKIHKEKISLDNSPKSKLLMYLEKHGVNKSDFRKGTGISFMALNRMRVIDSEDLLKIKQFLPKIDINWLIDPTKK